MNFISREHLFSYLKNLLFIGSGSHGECYLDKNTNKVYKIFNQYVDELDDDWKFNFTKENLLKFSNIENNTYIFPLDVIIVEDEIVGYICDYACGNSLFKTNPLEVNLDNFSYAISNSLNDIQIISLSGVKTFDVTYNTIYGDDGIKIIDCDDYSFSNMDKDSLFRTNCDNFNYEIIHFFIEGYFDEFISNSPLLKMMFVSKGVDINLFISVFRRYLSNVVGFEINYLKDAIPCLNRKKVSTNYKRRLLDNKKSC